MKEMKRILSLVLCLVMLVSMIPGTALTAFAAEGTPVVVVSGSDYQASTSGTTMADIAKKINASPVGILMGGDYDAGTVYPDASHLTAVDNTIASAFPSIAEENRIMIQGNHETYGNLSPDTNELLDDTGAYENAHYSVYAINYEDFSSASSDLQTYLNGKTGYTKPIFVITHQPLHATNRSGTKDATAIFNVLNAAGAKGLNIIFLFGHNHSGSYDDYLGGGAIYLKKGDSMRVYGGSSAQTLNFTYMNCGYVGYSNSGADNGLTMTAFEIYEDEVIIKRYDANGLHNLKSKGVATSGYTADTNVYGSAVLSLADGTSTIKTLAETESGSGDDNTGSGDNSGTTGGSGNVYTLDTDGIDAGEEYLIVSTGSDGTGSALTNNSGASTGTSVTISGGKITLDDANAVWIFSDASNGTAQNGTTGYYVYPSSTNGEDPVIRNASCDLRFSNEGNGEYTIKRNSSYSGYYVSSSSDWTYSSSETSVYLFKKTGTGTGGGSTVTPEGGDWVTVTAPNGGTTTYTYSQATSITADGKYVIVGNNNDVALLANGTSMDAQDVTITGTSGSQIMTSTTELTEWTFSGSTSGTVYNGTNYLYSSSNGYTFRIDDSSDTLYFANNGSNFLIKGSSSRNGYSFYYDGSEWATSGSRSLQYVRLFQLTKTEAGDDATPGLFAKITGNLEYNVERGLTDEQVLALVQAEIKGYEYSGTSAPGADVTGTEITEQLEFVLDSNYNGAKAGEYAVTISYKGIKLGTAKVIVPDVAITGYDCQDLGSVKVGATGKTRTGANITVNLADGTSYTVPVTLDMLSGDFTTDEAGTYTGLTVTYNGVKVCENFTLNVREPSPYPEYPDEGAVQVNKTGTGIQFQSTGVAQIEVSASGIPMNQGVDVLLVLDTSSSMGMEGSLTDGRTRIDVLKECVNALIANLQAERADGSVPDVSIAVVHFNGYTGNKNTNYIGSTARSTSTLGGVLTDDGNGDAWVDVQNMGSNWASNIPDNCSGTNYDHGLLLAYDLLSARQEAESSRKQFVLFMSDGAPFQYNGVNSNSLSSDWENWILGSYTQAEVEALSHVNNPEFYYGNNNGNGQKHRVAEAIKGTGTFEIVTYSDTSSSGTTKLEEVPGLGVTMYSVGLALEATNMPTDVAGQEAILKTIASSEDVFYSVTSAAGLQEAFDDFAGEVLMAATNARFVDQMGEAYDLQMGQILDLNDDPIGVENKIEIISYDIWTRSDYLAGTCTADQVGDRKGTFTVLETITFNADGTEVYSDKIFTTDTDGNKTYINILGDGTQDGFEKGVIYAKNFMYNANKDKAVAVNGVRIPTGVDENGLTTGETNMLPAETFYWNIGTIKTTELAMRYFVYLTGSMEGTREAGSYPTNNYATLYYNNYLNQPIGQPCQKPTFSPVMAWDAANVSYAFYLVDEDGNIIVNQTTGETGSFANKIAVTNPVVYEEILLNNTDTVESIEVASTGVLPTGYELYDTGAVYTIQIKSNATGSWNIAKGDGKVATTYVTHFDLKNPAAYSNELTKNSDADFTHTVVWFAVVWKVQALPDTVVIDYGLPVDISVLTNDMFGENGKLVAVGSAEGVNLDVHETALHANFLTNGQPKNSYQAEYGTAQVNANGKVRYTPSTMEMNGYDKFAYAVNYTGATNPGYYYDTVTVIPATTIYYEDNFLTYQSFTWNNGWTEVTDKTSDKWTWKQETETPDGVQAEDRPGEYSLTDANNIYGYDGANLSMSTHSLDHAAQATVNYDNKAHASFTFWGTGFDIISMTSNTTGNILVDIEKNVDGTWTEHDNFAVDTYYGYKQDADGNWVVDPEANDSLYQVPIIKMANQPYGQYRVTIKASYDPGFDHVDGSYENGSYDFYLDAIRIYDPANDGASDGTTDTTIEDAYVADGEGWPTYFELRNKLITTGTLGNTNTDNKIVGEVFIDGDATIGDAQLADYTSYGPNNEVYLAKNQSIAFKLSDVTIQKDGKNVSIVAQIHIGIKSADGEDVTYTIKNIASNSNTETGVEAGDSYHEKTATVGTATDMYYDITGYRNDIIVITNTSDGILSLTNIKATYTENPNAASVADEDGIDVASVGELNNGVAVASVSKQSNVSVLSTAAQTEPVETKTVETATNEVYAYMTPAAATLTLRSLNTPVVQEPEVTEPTEPEVTEPETTVPEETEPETTVPEETEPQKPSQEEVVKEIVKEIIKIIGGWFGKWF